MSEYQYYEFLAVDKPLSQKDQAYLRSISSRGHITKTSYKNEYNWGDFGGDPIEWMFRCFDAHVYIANWCAATFMVKVPIGIISKKIIEAVCRNYSVSIITSDTHCVITWSLDESEDYDRFAVESGEEWMSQLIAIRNELLSGDFRSLYLGWLKGVQYDEYDENELEPFPVDEMDNLTASQEALAEFIEVDQDIIAGAGLRESGSRPTKPDQSDIDNWLKKLPQDETLPIMKLLLNGDSLSAERNLKKLYNEWRNERQDIDIPLRTVQQLYENAKQAKVLRLEREKQAWKKQQKQLQKIRETRLKTLFEYRDKEWDTIRKTVFTGSGRSYDEACSMISELSDAYTLFKDEENFRRLLEEFIEENTRRRALIKRLEKAGLIS